MERPTAKDYARLFQEKFPARTEFENVLLSSFISLAQAVDELQLRTVKLGVGMKKMSQLVLMQHQGGQVATEEEAPQRPADNTPFPTGVSTSAPLGTKPEPVVQQAEAEIPQPDVVGGTAVNAAPIPSAPKGKKNGSKDVSA